MTKWHLCVPEEERGIGFKGENLVYRLAIQTDTGPEWAYKLDLKYQGGAKNIVDLSFTDGILWADLTRADLSVNGVVSIQVRGTQGEQEKHSNIAQLLLYDSICAVEAFQPAVPSEFEQIERRITGLKKETEDAANRAVSAAVHQPVIRDGYWWIWGVEAEAYLNAGALATSGVPHIGANGNWWVGDVDTGVSAHAVPDLEPMSNTELERILK